MKTVKSTRFGELKIQDDKLVTFEHGIPGFEEEQQFVVMPYAAESPFYVLQSANTDYLAFYMTDPFMFFDDYEFRIDEENMAELGIEKAEELAIFVMVTVPVDNVYAMTANLVAPVVLNTKNNKAKQIVLEKSPYKTKHRLFTDDAAGKGDEK